MTSSLFSPLRLCRSRSATSILHLEAASYAAESTTAVFGLKFNPNGSCAAVAHSCGLISIVDAHSCSIRSTLKGHTDSVNVVLWINDVTLASASQNGRIFVWDIRRNAPLLECTTETASAAPGVPMSRSSLPIKDLHYLESCHMLVSSGFDDTVRLWPLQVPQGSDPSFDARMHVSTSRGPQWHWLIQPYFADANVWLRADDLCRSLWVPNLAYSLPSSSSSSHSKRNNNKSRHKAAHFGTMVMTCMDSTLLFYDIRRAPSWHTLSDQPTKLSCEILDDSCVSYVTSILPLRHRHNQLDFVTRSVVIPKEVTGDVFNPNLHQIDNFTMGLSMDLSRRDLSARWYAGDVDCDPRFSKQPAVSPCGRFVLSPAGTSVRIFDTENVVRQSALVGDLNETLLYEDALPVVENRVMARTHGAPILCVDAHPFWPMAMSGALDGSLRGYQTSY
jgi:WD40 repeat protein